MYAVPDKINQADYALDAAVTLLEFYEDYFSIPYPLPKQGRVLQTFPGDIDGPTWVILLLLLIHVVLHIALHLTKFPEKF